MRIFVDARSFTRTHPGGKDSFAVNILSQIAKIDRDNKYFFFVDRPCSLALPDNCAWRIVQAPGLIWHLLVCLYILLERPDVFFASLSYIIPAINFGCQNVIMIYDLAVFSLPNKLVNKKAALIEKLFLFPAIKRSKKIFTISHYIQAEIKKLFNIPDSKISVIYPGVSPDFRIISDQVLKNTIILKYKLPVKFILFVGTIEPRKNLCRLVEAYAQLVRKHSLNDLSLILVGKQGWGHQQLLEKIKALNLVSKVIFLHYVPAADLVYLYNLATAFAFPSLDEGFGLPALEAMACGCPVITSNISALPEVAEGAAVLVDPYSVKEILAGLEKIIFQLDLAIVLRERGIERARQFSWTAGAKKILQEIAGL